MKIELEELNLADIVRQQVQAILLKQLGASLPKLVEEMLLEKPKYGKEDSLLREAFTAAIRVEVKAIIAAHMVNNREEIMMQVGEAIAEQFSPAKIADEVVSQLSGVQVKINPFNKSKKAESSPYGDDLE